MGARQSKSARYADQISGVDKEEIKAIQSVLDDFRVHFTSYNNRSIENIVAIREPVFFDVDKLRVIRKYSKNIRSFTDTHSLYEQQDFNEICKMESLEELRIRLVVDIEIDKAFGRIYKLKNLKSLFFDDSNMVYDDLEYMVQVFPNLEGLAFNASSIGFPKEAFDILSTMKNLKELTIEDAREIKKYMLDSIVKNVPNLTKLAFVLFRRQGNVEDSGESAPSKSCTQCPYETERHQFYYKLPAIPTLESFDSRQVWEYVGTQNLGVLAEKYPNLKEAHFRMIRGIDDEFVLKMTELWKDLRVVDLSSDKRDRSITIVGIEALVKHNPNIHTLDLRACFEISDKSIMALSTLRELKELKLDNCDLSTRGLVYLGKLKKLERLFITSNSVTTNIFLKLLKTLKLFELHNWQNEDKQHIESTKQKKESMHEISDVLYAC